MTEQKKLLINLSSSLLAFIVNIGISFFLTPYIVRSLGIEAYGFVQLGTNFINYASLLTIALNSMAGRFITIEIHRNNWEKANTYFTSVVFANLLIVAVMLIPSIFFIYFIDQIVNIPNNLTFDVQILFFFLFLNFFISTIVSTYSIGTFATNKIYLNSLRGMEANILRVLILILTFGLFRPSLAYIGIAAFVMSIYNTIFNFYYFNKLLPQLKIRKNYFNFKAIFEIVSSGIWNTIIRLGQLLLDGLNLLISNIFISATAMGMLSVANTVPMVMSSLIGTIAGVFMPDFTILYAKNNKEELISSIKRSMKILGIITNIPIGILVAFGEEFFSLWVPNQDAKTLQILSVLTVTVLIVSGSINSLYNVFTVTNKVKINALILLFTGIINILLVLLLLHTTNLGVYAVLIVSVVLGIIRNLAFTAPYGAIMLGVKWKTFYPEIIKSVLGFIIILVVGIGINSIFLINTWITLIIYSILTASLGFILNIMLFFNKSERENMLKQIIRIK